MVNNRIKIIGLFWVLLLLGLIGCTKSNLSEISSTNFRPEEDLEWEQPKVSLNYEEDSVPYSHQLMSGESEFTIQISDDEYKCITTDATPILLTEDLLTISLNRDQVDEIVITFSDEPTAYVIKRWDIRYLGDELSQNRNYDILEVDSDDTILTSDLQGSYVYEISVDWDYGSAKYGIILNVN